MALHRYERIYTGTTVRSPIGSLLYVRAPVTGTIKRVDVWTGSNLSIGTAVFNVYQNGTALWTGGSRPTIASGSLVVSKTGLSFAVTRGDILTLDLESIGQAGPPSPITFLIEIDDGDNGLIEFGLAASDETTALATGSAKAIFHVQRAFTLTDIWAGLSTASTLGLVTVNVKKNGTTIFTTKITIDANEKTSLTAAAAYALSSSPTTFAKGDEIQIDIDGAGTGAKGLKVYFEGTR